MKYEIDTFSGYKIQPGHGILFVRSDSKIFRFFSEKTLNLFLDRKNPKDISWTVAYRRMHDKHRHDGHEEIEARAPVKKERGFVGASLDHIRQRRAMNPQERQSEREKAIARAKEQQAARLKTKEAIRAARQEA